MVDQFVGCVARIRPCKDISSADNSENQHSEVDLVELGKVSPVEGMMTQGQEQDVLKVEDILHH